MISVSLQDMCDEILVMYGGRVCERGTADDIFYRPAHEYTKGLLRSIPKADNIERKAGADSAVHRSTC